MSHLRSAKTCIRVASEDAFFRILKAVPTLHNGGGAPLKVERVSPKFIQTIFPQKFFGISN